MDFTSLARQKADLEKQLSELCADDSQTNLLDGTSKQQLFFIKNKPRIIFDSHSGYMFPNPDYFNDILQLFDTGVDSTNYNNYLKHIKSLTIEGYASWIFPDDDNFLKYYITALHVIDNYAQEITSNWYFTYANQKKERTRYLLSISSIRESNRITDCYYEYNLPRIDKSSQYNKRVMALPFCSKFYSSDFNPGNKVYSQEERANKVLNLFIQEGWIPKFDDEDLTKLYEKMYVIRPELVKQMAEINEALAVMPAPKVGFADGFDFNELIKDYDLATIRNSHVQYYAETIRWFDNLLTNLDAFIREHADLLAEAQTLTNRLTVAHHDDEYTVLTERAEYLAHHLDFGVETLQSELIAFKNEAVAGRDILANARNLASLREIEKLERPDFYLVAEHTAGMVKRQLVGVDWFKDHKELAKTLIDLHETWRDDFHLFEHTTRDHFMQKCMDESIADEQADGWFAEWRKERLLLEEHLLPLMKSGIEKVIPVEVVIAAVDVLKTTILDQLAKFFFDERIALHQKFAFEPGGVIQERFEKEAELTKINSEFQKKLEDLVFKVDASEGRLFLVRWAKDWYDSLIGDMLAFIEKDTLQEQIARDTLDEFRAMKRRNLEAFLMDTKSYAEARELIDKQWNSLVFRMRSDLVKKNGKGSK